MNISLPSLLGCEIFQRYELGKRLRGGLDTSTQSTIGKKITKRKLKMRKHLHMQRADSWASGQLGPRQLSEPQCTMCLSPLKRCFKEFQQNVSFCSHFRNI